MSAFDIFYIQYRRELPSVYIDEFIQKPIRLKGLYHEERIRRNSHLRLKIPLN